MVDKEKVLTGLECCRMNGKGCRRCPYDKECAEMIGSGSAHLCSDALELLKEQPEQKFFVDSDGKMTPLPVQKHGHWKGFTRSRYYGMDDDGEPIFRDGLFYICSECRRKSIIKHPFCPQCGAKMDEEVEQE